MITYTKHFIRLLIALLTIPFVFNRCSKAPIEEKKPSFCCDIYGQYTGSKIHTSIYAGHQQYTKHIDTTDYEFSISPKGMDSISITEYNLTTQSAYQHDLPLMKMATETVIFGGGNNIYHTFDSLVCIFHVKNDVVHLEQRKRRQRAPGNSLEDISHVFKGVKQ
ncbi:hypothetical protein [Aureispira anguillae]|nr:hypothetical protein [Aureispira anguillae]